MFIFYLNILILNFFQKIHYFYRGIMVISCIPHIFKKLIHNILKRFYYICLFIRLFKNLLKISHIILNWHKHNP
jgi:hypothetical protein